MSIIGKSASDWLGSVHVDHERKLQRHQNYGSPLVWTAVRTGIAGALRMISLWIGRSNQRNALADLDDHLLCDIGVSSEDAGREASKPFWKP
jgi:uncharacterized protein YjiS (DUF1127 family)